MNNGNQNDAEMNKMWIDEYRSEAYDRLVEQHWIETYPKDEIDDN